MPLSNRFSEPRSFISHHLQLSFGYPQPVLSSILDRYVPDVIYSSTGLPTCHSTGTKTQQEKKKTVPATPPNSPWVHDGWRSSLVKASILAISPWSLAIMKDSLFDRLWRRECGDLSPYASLRGIYGSKEWIDDLDIVNELGGHTGCVNALRYV